MPPNVSESRTACYCPGRARARRTAKLAGMQTPLLWGIKLLAALALSVQDAWKCFLLHWESVDGQDGMRGTAAAAAGNTDPLHSDRTSGMTLTRLLRVTCLKVGGSGGRAAGAGEPGDGGGEGEAAEDEEESEEEEVGDGAGSSGARARRYGRRRRRSAQLEGEDEEVVKVEEEDEAEGDPGDARARRYGRRRRLAAEQGGREGEEEDEEEEEEGAEGEAVAHRYGRRRRQMTQHYSPLHEEQRPQLLQSLRRSRRGRQARPHWPTSYPRRNRV